MNTNQEEQSSIVLSNSNSSNDGQRKTKRKKTSRACNHCHKTHMTCDPGRPCKRCIQKGLQATCEDAPRKRKKYLEDVPNSSLLTSRSMNSVNLSYVSIGQSTETPELHQDASISQLHSQPHPHSQQQPPAPPHQSQTRPPLPVSTGSHIGMQSAAREDSSGTPTMTGTDYSLNHKTYQATMFQHSSTAPNLMHSVSEYFPELYNLQFQPPEHPNQKRRTNFLSSAADLEYATLSSILHETFGHHSTSNEGTPNSHNFSPALSPHNMATNGVPSLLQAQEHQNPSTTDQTTSISSTDHLQLPGKADSFANNGNNNNILTNHTTPSPLNPTRTSIYEDSRYPKCDETINQYFLGETESGQVAVFPDVLTAIIAMKNHDPAVYIERNAKLELSFTIGILHEDNANGNSREDTFFKEPEEIYAKVNKPFSYTPGYHSLIAYLRKRFDKPMLVKMAESMATYRPSFIACTNSLKEHDLIFMEQCFQRTLLTYDNIIKLSGTPTIVWRRTGEIAYVGNEFCVLTGWTKEELVGNGKRKFIVELLDDKSVLEYFQVFSRIAFGDFLGATMTECTLLTPNPDVKIRSGCMWTLKRDVFGIPMMIVGNFLPILSNT